MFQKLSGLVGKLKYIVIKIVLATWIFMKYTKSYKSLKASR